MLSDQTNALTLERLLHTVGLPLLDVLVAPLGLGVVVKRTELVDAADRPAVSAGTLVLLVTDQPSGPAGLRTVRTAAETGAAAVVVKGHGQDLAPLVAAAETSGVAVLVAANEAPWRHLDGLVTSMLSSETDGMDAALGPGDELFAVANAVAGAVGGSVAIEDLGRHVLAYSTVPDQRIDELRRQGILDRRVPPGPDDPDQYRQVLTAEGVVHFPGSGDELPRMAVAVRAGSVTIGTLWAIEGDDPPDVVCERRALEGARLAALALLRRQSLEELERSQRSDLLRGLLYGRVTPTTAWSRLGLPAGHRSVLLGAAAAWSRQSASLLAEIDRSARRSCLTVSLATMVATNDRVVYVLLAGEDPDKVALAFAEHLLSLLDGSGLHDVHLAISEAAVGPADLPVRRSEVDQILQIAATAPGTPRVARFDDVRCQSLLVHLRQHLRDHPELAHPAVARLLEMDAEKGSELAASVLAWIEAHGDIRSAAEAIAVHPNTVRYRVRRARLLTGLRLDDPDERLVVWLQLRESASGPS